MSSTTDYWRSVDLRRDIGVALALGLHRDLLHLTAAAILAVPSDYRTRLTCNVLTAMLAAAAGEMHLPAVRRHYQRHLPRQIWGATGCLTNAAFHALSNTMIGACAALFFARLASAWIEHPDITINGFVDDMPIYTSWPAADAAIDRAEETQKRLYADIFGAKSQGGLWIPTLRRLPSRWPDVRGLARHIYATDDWSMTGVLADGCEDHPDCPPEIVEHLRSPGPHVRGCWAIDWLRGV